MILRLVATLCLAVAPALAQRPITGMPVPELSFLDDTVHAFMDTSLVRGVVLGVADQGRIIYMRGFGWQDEALTEPLQENAVMRIASITKTFTAAIIIDLVDRGLLSLDDQAFDIAHDGSGILDLEPFPTAGSLLLDNIRISHLLQHTAGWDRIENFDLTTRELQIQDEMGLAQLPTRAETMRWILGHPLQHVPGSEYEYSNEGYVALGLIAEQVSGIDLLSYVRTYLLTEDLWFPMTDIFMGFTREADVDQREPFYNTPWFTTNVFDPDGPDVRASYGGRYIEIRNGQGRIVAGAAPLLHHAHRFYLNGDERGQPIGEVHVTRNHGGALAGSNSLLRQRDDGIDYIILTNRYVDVTHAVQLGNLLQDVLDANVVPPLDETVDCRWMDFGYGGAEQGSYEMPFGSVNDLGSVPPFSKVKIKPGSSAWTGVVTRGKLLLTSTRTGSAVIGK